MKKMVSRSAIVAAACLLTTLAIAEPPMGRSGGLSGRDPAQMVSHMADRLDLSEDQQTEITALLTAEQEKMQNEHYKLTELRNQLMSQTDEFDDDKVREITNDMGVISGELAYSRTFTFSEINKILTEDQQAKLESFLKDRGDRSGGRGGRESRHKGR